MSSAAPGTGGERLEIRDLRIAFGSRVVAQLETLRLGPGEMVGLAGESGAGKSMTAMAILGLATHVGATVSGSIRFDGEQLVGAPEQRLREIRGRRIAAIFQNPVSSFNPVYRVGEAFIGSLRLHGASAALAKERSEAAIREVLLPADVLRRYPHQLSGGQAQRVAIAQALALRAEVLLADEPTSALDVTVQAEVLDTLRRVRDEVGMSILFISHDLAVLAELSDSLAVMQTGRIVESGPTGQVLEDPRDEYTRELVAAVPKLGTRPVG